MSPEELEEMRRDALSPERREEFRRSALAVGGWERDHPVGLADILEWIDQLRTLFGEPVIDRAPWRGEDFRL